MAEGTRSGGGCSCGITETVAEHRSAPIVPWNPHGCSEPVDISEPLWRRKTPQPLSLCLREWFSPGVVLPLEHFCKCPKTFSVVRMQVGLEDGIALSGQNPGMLL